MRSADLELNRDGFQVGFDVDSAPDDGSMIDGWRRISEKGNRIVVMNE
jgi:hypothetical protein